MSLKRAGRQRVGEVEAVDAGVFHPGLQLLGDFAGRTDQHRAASADRGMAGRFRRQSIHDRDRP